MRVRVRSGDAQYFGAHASELIKPGCDSLPQAVSRHRIAGKSGVGRVFPQGSLKPAC